MRSGNRKAAAVTAAAACLVVLGGLAAGIIAKDMRAQESRLAAQAQVRTAQAGESLAEMEGAGDGGAADGVETPGPERGSAAAGQEAPGPGSSERSAGSEALGAESGKRADGVETPGPERGGAAAGSEASEEGSMTGQAGKESGGSEPEEPSLRSSSDIVMLFAGDVYFSDHVLNAYDSGGGIQGILDEGIRREIQEADIFMVNQEFPFTVRGTAAQDKQFTFRVPESRIHILKEMGVDIVTLANNHILDFGQEGLLDSCKALDEAGIARVGGGKDFKEASAVTTIIVGQKTIGFLGMSRVYMDASWAAGKDHPGVFSTYDTTWPLKAIEEARDACDYLVVYVHWGVEREETPKDYQRAMGRAYIDAGADLVVGSHPHVLQPVEEYNGKTIVYSLGNFVFGSSIPKTALLKVVWGEEGTEVSMIPCTSSAGYTRMENCNSSDDP